MTQKFHTVNVIKQIGVSVAELVAFADTPEGNKSAEELFKNWVNNLAAANVFAETLDAFLEDGIYQNGDTSIIICHSTGEGEAIPYIPATTADLVHAVAVEIVESTEEPNDLAVNMGVFLADFVARVSEETHELASDYFEICTECGSAMKGVMVDTDGINLEPGTECSNPDCPTHEEVDNTD
jgi:hypothetical protein